MKKIFTKCDQCKKTIYVGDSVWFKGIEYYCCAKCLTTSFNSDNLTKKSVLREKHIDLEGRGWA